MFKSVGLTEFFAKFAIPKREKHFN